jgi:hypothetical protein
MLSISNNNASDQIPFSKSAKKGFTIKELSALHIGSLKNTNAVVNNVADIK